MKRAMALTLVLCMMLVISGAAIDYNTTTSNAEVIPVHGYVGPDAYVTPPDPEKSETEIYVQVPVQIMFAAFESDAGAVTSPKFTITNLSEVSDVKVEVEQFVQRSFPDVDVDGKLSLKLVDFDNQDLVSNLFPADYQTPKLLTGNLSRYVEGVDGNELEFMVGGMWSGTFADELKPAFDMTVKFSAVE